ncbi:MAG TPA: Mur ligase family protein, partial [Candidatus Saccharimonadales bacterium]|nr:Mur ligase family protein [Candidatus Saccharimonadales bacterium]
MKVAIAGYGVEGKASYKYWRSLGEQVTIVDEQAISAHDLPYGAAAITGPGSFKALDGFDLVVRSPGIAPDRLNTGGKVWSATNEFMTKCQTPIIGVTGSKGKGTTASLIDSILRAAGKKTVLVGNIGRPALEVLDEANQADAVVYEMSSFQLWDITKSPHVAVLLPIEPDHLDVHKGMRDYVEAKMNIVRFQSEGDVCVCHYSHRDRPEFPDTQAGYLEYPSPASVYTKDGWFYAKDRRLCPVGSLKLPGQHNIDNACAAIIAALTMISAERVDEIGDVVSRGLGGFSGLPHRLKLVAKKAGVGYYDDSIA